MYCSQNTLLKKRQSRRDDLESLLYMVLRLCHSRLPWQHLGVLHGTRQICAKRAKLTDEEIEEAIQRPFKPLYRYVRSLKYAEAPDYERVVNLFEDL